MSWIKCSLEMIDKCWMIFFISIQTSHRKILATNLENSKVHEMLKEFRYCFENKSNRSIKHCEMCDSLKTLSRGLVYNQLYHGLATLQVTEAVGLRQKDGLLLAKVIFSQFKQVAILQAGGWGNWPAGPAAGLVGVGKGGWKLAPGGKGEEWWSAGEGRRLLLQLLLSHLPCVPSSPSPAETTRGRRTNGEKKAGPAKGSGKYAPWQVNSRKAPDLAKLAHCRDMFDDPAYMNRLAVVRTDLSADLCQGNTSRRLVRWFRDCDCFNDYFFSLDSHVHCHRQLHIHPYLRLCPHMVEELNRRPYIALFHRCCMSGLAI